MGKAKQIGKHSYQVWWENSTVDLLMVLRGVKIHKRCRSKERQGKRKTGLHGPVVR